MIHMYEKSLYTLHRHSISTAINSVLTQRTENQQFRKYCYQTYASDVFLINSSNKSVECFLYAC